MKTRSLVGILITLISILLIASIALLIFRHLERRAQIDFGQEVVTGVLQEIQELKKMGFAEKDEAMQAMRSRAKRSQHKVDELKQQWHLFTKKRALKTIDKKKLARLIQLNKKMIRSYAQDLNEYYKLGIPPNTKAVSFAKEHIGRLALALTDLKKQQAAIEKGELVSMQQAERIRRMIEINKQSMDYYKTELNDYTKQGLALQEPKVQLAKRQLTQKARAINALEKLLE